MYEINSIAYASSEKIEYNLRTYFVASSVYVCDSSMRQQDVVGNDIRLSGRISSSAEEMEENGAAPGRLEPDVVALNRECVGLIECYPVLHPVSKHLEACLCVVCVVFSANDINETYL